MLESGENIWNALTSENRLSWPTMPASLIDVSIDCKTDKKKRLSVAHRLPGATKNESVYFKTVYFVLLAVKAKEIKKRSPIHEAQEPRPQLLFHRPRFFSV